MELKIEELNQKYRMFRRDVENYNTKFTQNFKNFYQYAIAAGEEDFQKGIQATKKLKNLLDAQVESSKYANQIIVKEAFESMQILITILLQSSRWQDNNAGIWILICYFESQYKFLDIQKLSQIIKLNLTQYLEESEEIFQENISKLLSLLNQNDIFQIPEYLVIQEKLIQSMNSSLQLSEKFQDYFQVIINYLNQNNHNFIGLHTSKVDVQEKYFSKIQLSPLLQILKELKTKTNNNNYIDLLLKCCLVNQKQTQLSAFNLLLQVEDTDQNDFIEVLRYSLLHNNFEIIKLGTQLAKQVIKNFECNKLSHIKLLIFLNQDLQAPVKETSVDLLENKFKIPKIDSIVRDNMTLILNICSIQAQNKDQIFRQQSWRNLFRAIKAQSNEELSQNIEQIIKICQTAQNETDEGAFFYFLHFFDQLIQKKQDLDKNQKFLFAKIICNFIGQFKSQQTTDKIVKVFKILDFNDEQLSQLYSQSDVQNSKEFQQSWRELRQQLQTHKQIKK
ncbi:unnamed protein product [Paramecium primaurelia]|uniref:Uncharacterized protein n=1 Tax=Paramecium primaurelia TaxID=5886 RepID=A0A8S1LJD5_PARPR|nr:unnamed protein product [Paramecium primaurelia]